MDAELRARLGDRRPTARRTYALAAACCERLGPEFQPAGAAASALVERLRRETGNPAAALGDTEERRRREPP